MANEKYFKIDKIAWNYYSLGGFWGRNFMSLKSVEAIFVGR